MIFVVDRESANNLKSIQVTFNQEINEDTIDNVTATDASGNDVATTNYLSEDGETITLVKNSASFNQHDKVTVTVDGVENTDGDAVEYEEVVTVTDVKAPEVVSATATSSKTIDVYFSEPVDLTEEQKVWSDVFELDGVDLFADLTNHPEDNKITLNLSSSMDVGAHILVVKDTIKDYGTFPVSEKELGIDVAEDSEAPYISSAELRAPGTVRVVFSEPVVESSIATSSNDFTVKAAGQSATQISSVTKVNSTTFDLDLVTALDAGAIVNTEITYKGVTDLEGNDVEDALSYEFVAPNDTDEPTASVTKVENGNVYVQFSEPVDSTAVTNAFELYDSNDTKVRATGDISASADPDVENGYILSPNSKADLDGNYTLKLLDDVVSDTSIRSNFASGDTFAVTFEDTKAPGIVNSELTGELKTNDDSEYTALELKVPFNDKMDAETATDLDNYILNNGTGTDIILSNVTGAEATLSADGTFVTVNVPSTESTLSTTKLVVNSQDFTPADLTATNYDLKVLGVNDDAGNTLVASDINSAKTVNEFDASSLTLTSAEVTGKRTVVISSNTAFKSIKANQIRFVERASGTDVAQEILVAGVTFSDDMKKATLSLNTDLKADGTGDTDESDGYNSLDLVTISDDAIVDSMSRYVANGSLTDSNTFDNTGAVATNVTDAINPSVSVTSETATDLTLSFSEEVNATSTAELASDIIIRDEDGTIVPLDFSGGASDNTEFSNSDADDESGFTSLTISDLTSGEEYTVEVISRYIEDANTNGLDALTET
ncbi:Ig-like domain-containing protein [Gracilibacillus sp. YIM 98692]|uniref:Ig-like domain-containing protein n=1 Tax=Gracilibacillus sp. YIM 98692 TaxID=2663532 RepID=UPI0013D65BF6|nr:Ig-like domain-containing protein [Gracilibacillus sp. YIM 98692]